MLDLKFGDLAEEVSERFGDRTGTLPVFGVDRSVGITSETKYSAKDLAKYKIIEPGMFAYNPMRLNIGSIGLCTPDLGIGLISPDYVVFRPVSGKLDAQFLLYYTKTAQWSDWVELAGEGSVRERIYFRNLARNVVSVPPYREQREIAAVLSGLDHKVQLNRAASTKLEEMARALYRSWFVDFDPVRAKFEGRAPAHMSPATAALFPDSFGEDGLPEGWRIGTLSDVAHLNPSKHTKQAHPETLEYVDLANTKWGTIGSTASYTWDNAPSRARMALAYGDTIVGTVRPGNGSYAFISQDGLTGSTGFAVLRPKAGTDSSFTYLAATDPATIDALTNLADGGAYPAVRPDVVAAQKIVIPPADILAAFSVEAAPLITRIEVGKAENQTLATLRDTLLPRLMSGEIRVDAAREQVEAAQ